MFIPTPLLLVSWICTIRGWAILQSLLMAIAYFVVAYALRRPIWSFVAALYENVISYNVLKDILNEWIPKIKMNFRFALGYSLIGASGALGAIFYIQPLLWIYAVYLLVTWTFNVWQMYRTLQAILGLQGDLEKACTYVGGILGLGDCGEFFGDVRIYTIVAMVSILTLQLNTLVCVGVLIWRKYRKTGFLLTDVFASEEEKNKRLEAIEQRKEDRQKVKMDSLGHARPPRQRLLEKSSLLLQPSEFPVSDGYDECFDLPRRQRVTARHPPLPDGRRRRGNFETGNLRQ